MPSTPALDISTAYASSSPSAQDKVPAGTLDSDHGKIEAWSSALLAALAKTIRDDDTLVDEIVRLRNLHPEVVEALEGLTVLAAATVCSTTNQAALSGLLTIDGYTVIAGDRILLVAQTNAVQNGVWTAAAGAWTRPSDYASGSAQVANSVLDVLNGTVQTGSTWRLVSDVTVDSSSETWNQLSGLGSLIPLTRGGTGASTAPAARTALGGVGSITLVVATMAALKALSAADCTGTVLLQGYYAAGDGGGGLFRWIASDAATANDGTIVQPSVGGGRFYRVYDQASGLYVAWFGAKGDGATDDTSALQNACNALVSLGGGALNFGRGLTYMHGAEILIDSCDGFAINGNGSTLKSANATTVASGYAGLFLKTCGNFTVRNLTIDGNRANRTPAEVPAHLLQLYQPYDFLIEQVQVLNAVCDGIYLAESGTVTLANAPRRGRFIGCRANNAYRQGMSIIQGRDLAFYGCEFSDTVGTAPQCGVDLEPNGGDPNECIRNILFDGCVFFGNSGFGLQITSIANTRDVIVRGCRFTTGTQGAINQGGKNVLIQGCMFHDIAAATRGVIDVLSTGGWNENTAIVDCTFRDLTLALGGNSAVYIHSNCGGKVTVEQCRFINIACGGVVGYKDYINISRNIFNVVTGGAAASLAGTSNHSIIVGNVFIGCTKYNVYVEAGCDYAIVEGNTCIDGNNSSGPTAGTMRFIGANATIRGNVLRLVTTPDASHYGIRIDNGAAVVDGNTIVGYSVTLDIQYKGSAVYDPPSLADGAGATTTVTVTGAALGDYCEASFSLDLQGITLTSWVSAANTVSVRFQNESGGVLDLASGTLRARIRKV